MRNGNDIIKHNYGIIMKTILEELRLQSTFYDIQMGFGKNRWSSLCGGVMSRGVDVELLYSKTGVDKKYLRGEKRLELFKQPKEMKDLEYIQCIKDLINRFDNNPNEVKEELYDEAVFDLDFRKLFFYCIKIKTNKNITLEDKIDVMMQQINYIIGRDYLSISTEKLTEIESIYENHLSKVRAALVLKD